MSRGQSWREWSLRAAREEVRAVRARLALLPDRWRAWVGVEWERRGGAWDGLANAWLLGATAGIEGRVSLASSDEDLRAAARRAAGDCKSLAEFAVLRGEVAAVDMMTRQCALYGIDPPVARGCDLLPSVKRMACARWWLRRLRRAHGRRCDGAAIRAGVVRRGLWPYASQDAVERRRGQRSRNALAVARASVSCVETGEVLPLAEVVAGSIANPEVKRAELMVRIRGCDAIAHDEGMACEFWTLTAPSRFHARRVVKGKVTEANPVFDGSTPKAAQVYLSKVWARARAAWARAGLSIYGLRTAEPHHDGCPHWHLIAYGPADDMRIARWILRRYALRDAGYEDGARRHRFVVLPAKKGRYGAAYAAKYIAKNINGRGMGKAGDGEAGRPVADSVKRVDAWAAVWGIRQFQFFGCPPISIWRALRRMSGPVGVVGSMLERARSAADDGDFAEWWRCVKRGGLCLIYRLADKLTAYGDAAASRIAGVCEGARRALLPVKEWVVCWSGAVGVAFDFPRSCVNNCTRPVKSWADDAAAAVFSIGDGYGGLMAR